MYAEEEKRFKISFENKEALKFVLFKLTLIEGSVKFIYHLFSKNFKKSKELMFKESYEDSLDVTIFDEFLELQEGVESFLVFIDI